MELSFVLLNELFEFCPGDLLESATHSEGQSHERSIHFLGRVVLLLFGDLLQLFLALFLFLILSLLDFADKRLDVRGVVVIVIDLDYLGFAGRFGLGSRLVSRHVVVLRRGLEGRLGGCELLGP